MSIYKRQPYLAGEDIDSTCCKMSAVNLAMHGCFGEIVCHNTLSEPDVVRMGYIINETMYPIPTPVPSIRRCTDPNAFVCTSAMLAARRRQDIEEKPKPEPKAEVKVEEKKGPVQLTLF